MKLKACILSLLIIGATAFNAHSATSLSTIARWPYTPVASFLHPSPNAVTSGDHSHYSEPLLLWAVGDTISILQSDTMARVAVFRVDTATIIHDIHYASDAGSETLYIAAGKGGLMIYDLSGLTETPATTQPLQKGSLSQAPTNPGSRVISDTETIAIPQIDARGLGVFGDHVFLADVNFGMRVIDVTDPDHPSEEPLAAQDAIRMSGYKQPDVNGTYKTTGGYTNATVCEFGGRIYAFMLDYYYGLRAFDVTNPAVISTPVSKDMRSNLLYGSIALVTGLLATQGPDGSLYAYVTALDTYAQQSAALKLRVLSPGADLGDSPIITTGKCLTPGDATGIAVSDLTGFVADSDKGLQIIDFSTPVIKTDVPEYPIIGSFDTDTRGSYSVTISGDHAFMAVAENGLQKINVATATHPVHVQTVTSPISGDAVIYDNNHTYLLDGDSGLLIFDSSKPSELIHRGTLEISGTSYDLAVSGNHAYIANGEKGLTLIDISNKSIPILIPRPPTTPTADAAMAVAIYEKGVSRFACVANGSATPYLLINVTDPLNPRDPIAADTTGFTPGTARDVAVHGDHAFFADEKGLKVVDLSDPTAPAIIAEKDTTGTAVAVAIFTQASEMYALIADSTQGITIENVTDPSAIPETVAVIPPPETGSYKHIDAQTHFAFAVAGKNGLTAFDLTDPANPETAASYQTKSSAEQVSAFVKDDLLYTAVAEKYHGLVINKVSETSKQEPSTPLGSSTSSSSCFINSASRDLF
ncbi:hypothetical protein [Desulfoluna sp.]|uniref:hypothetical protein n=1 Tax=Desulfoluna sp. TaxID=2045199 RepID=UPI002616CB44|nr:hypothetical protein [Desulfoluna sp.]